MQNLFLSPFYAPLLRMGLLLLTTTIQIGLRETSAVQTKQLRQKLKKSQWNTAEVARPNHDHNTHFAKLRLA